MKKIQEKLMELKENMTKCFNDLNKLEVIEAINEKKILMLLGITAMSVALWIVTKKTSLFLIILALLFFVCYLYVINFEIKNNELIGRSKIRYVIMVLSIIGNMCFLVMAIDDFNFYTVITLILTIITTTILNVYLNIEKVIKKECTKLVEAELTEVTLYDENKLIIKCAFYDKNGKVYEYEDNLIKITMLGIKMKISYKRIETMLKQLTYIRIYISEANPNKYYIDYGYLNDIIKKLI